MSHSAIARRKLLQVAGAAFTLGVLPLAHAQGRAPEVIVYLNPGCECCHRWQDHMRANGFTITTVALDNVIPLKRKLGVPAELDSCHTAVVRGYVVEGHVPAADVKRLLREGSAKGLAVAGMVPGSPGMEGATARPYDTIAFDGANTRVFARH